jgi:hypothetical protein
MTSVRIFLKPAGERWVDVTLPTGTPLGALYNVLQHESVVITDYAIIPKDAVFYIATTAPAAAPPKPPLTLFPGGAGSGNGKPEGAA